MRWLLLFLLASVVFNHVQPWLRKLGLGRIPGDFQVKVGGRDWFFPLGSSVLLSLLVWLLGRLL